MLATRDSKIASEEGGAHRAAFRARRFGALTRFQPPTRMLAG
jgi:hypothetical protein